MDRRAWQATVHGVAKESDMTEHTCIRENVITIIKVKVKVLVGSDSLQPHGL